MDNQDSFLHRPTTPTSSSSAIDLTGTPAGIASSLPPSPSLEPLDSRNAFSRRRPSRGDRLDAGQDPLTVNITTVGPSSSQFGSISMSRAGPSASSLVLDDPFSPVDEPSDLGRDYDLPSSLSSRYGTKHRDINAYSSSPARPSTVSLMTAQGSSSDGHREDDEAHLTANMSKNGPPGNWGDEDTEYAAGASPRSRRRTVRYSTSPSPLKKTGTVLKSMSQNIRRVSLRVVNLAGAGLEEQVRLPDDDPQKPPDRQGDADNLPDLTFALPIRGCALGFLGPENQFRLSLYNFLVHQWTEPIILVLIIINAVVLTIQASRSSTLPSNGSPSSVDGYFHSWEDYALFGLFIIFTFEAIARICVSGFILDPEMPISSLWKYPASNDMGPMPSSGASVSRQDSFIRRITLRRRWARLNYNLMRPFALSSTSSNSLATESSDNIPASEKPSGIWTSSREDSQPSQVSRTRATEKGETISLPFKLSIKQVHDKTRRNVPYLRHSWSRIDFVAILSFWITFGLATGGIERGTQHIGVFRAMSTIRTARLLTVTSGTTTIMHSLKTARPLLTSVAYFVLFAILLFSIIGIQSFKGSLRRSCYLISPGQPDIQLSQFCGGYIDPTFLNVTGYIQYNGLPSTAKKGYICPLGQSCKEEANPMANLESFDTIYNAALQVIIVASANGWSPLMYSMIDSEFFVSCFFFIICVVVLNFWLINLFVAVITNTFAAIRSETQKSAFGAQNTINISDETEEAWALAEARRANNSNLAKKIYDKISWFWVLLALLSLSLQASRTVEVDDLHQMVMYWGELTITIAFDFEIVLRILAALPDWRSFFRKPNNWLDLILAIGSSIIQIPVIHNSSVYPWFTILQLARFYRVILEVPRMRPLLLAVFGNMYGLANMSLFLLLVNYIAALAAVQLLRGDLPASQAMNFGQLFTSFLAMYQVFSSENWTNILYNTTQAEAPRGQVVITTLFVTCWLLFANFIVLQMFIAVINENFDVAEEAKKGRQKEKYLEAQKTHHARYAWMKKFNPYRWFKPNPVTVKVENLPSNLVLPVQKALVQAYDAGGGMQAGSSHDPRPRHKHSKSLNALQKLFSGEVENYDVPLETLRHPKVEVSEHDLYEDPVRQLELLASGSRNDRPLSLAANDDLHERLAQKADFIRSHPTYDKTFWIFSQKNPIRRMCQKVVQSANGQRIFGSKISPIAHPMFQLFLLSIVVGGIVVESIATPVYRRNFHLSHPGIQQAWFDLAEAVFGLILTIEFLIKIIADGFVFTPNAYIRSIWNIFDFVILIGLLINVTTGLLFVGGLSRLTRSLKAFRALRLITLIDRMRNTFESLIISGAMRIMDAAILAILYMIPYAVWGLNIFAGKMNQCNDETVQGLSDCVNEYPVTVAGNSYGYLVPHVWDNPAPSTVFSFDSFRASLLILFEIVSLEGWVDVMGVATSITGEGLQPQTNASQVNAIFFLIYNLMGGVVILTLFISIIIGNFSAKTGSAYLTQPQREWIDLQKLFKRQRPSKRPLQRPALGIRAWCFDRAVNKHGWWSRMMTLVFILHIIALMTQTFSTQTVADAFRNDFFLVIMAIYLVDVGVRWYGLGWTSFRANGWNVFDIIVAGGSFITTLVVRFGTSEFLIEQLQKLFLVSIAFKLVQRTNSLNMLFKTAVASLPVILSLLGLWLILFVFFAILFVEVFGMTKWGTAESYMQNYSSIGSALVMLAFMSTGEGWNQYMHDFALEYPRCTNSSTSKQESDCGSIAWAFTLFISWNLLSMYIFVNMFTGVVVENFSYVFQTSTGGAKAITREQMRAFKKTWGEYADPNTGHLPRAKFGPFLAKLTGAFEVRIYPQENNIKNILAVCQEPPKPGEEDKPYNHRIDMEKLSKVLNNIDYTSIRKRRAVYTRLYHEALISDHQGRGMSFTSMLFLLAHHRLIVDRDALVFKDLVARTEKTKVVTDLVNLDRVQSLLKTIWHRRRFLKEREAQRAKRIDSHEIPSIIVNEMPATPPRQTLQLPFQGSDSLPGSPASDRRFSGPDISLVLDPNVGSRLQRGSRRTSDISMLSLDSNYRSPRTSIADEDPHAVLSSMQHSVWGGMMQAAAEEEEQR
ncbi:hypothetical protein BDN72DRAFT_646515 [Pluteus cervinus]|uniref:Uncharacterized protein n=1 Tax=Pluteus cervinus TaxID=181527 RepID=A0ACD3ATM1_9AGAR|nr:hypothetical protein BDN72DRAFT_646515 [Pluteus cervinus]